MKPHKPGDIVDAEPFCARQCPECEVWIYTAAGPFAEGDRTKTMADALHVEAEHPALVADGFFPFMSYNETPVQAVYEGR